MAERDVLLRIEHLHKKYDENAVLDDVNLEVHQGEVVVLIGPSGCGKSTLLRCINALEPIQGGRILLGEDEVSIKDKKLYELRQKIGMVFQSYELFSHLTVIDNICLSPVKVQKRKKEEVRAEAMELLERVGLKEKADSYPRQLSGGQKQRVAIARALVNNPAFLLADEPTGALDSKTSGEIMDVFEKLNQGGKTVIIVTHDMEVAARCGRVIEISDGEIV